MDDNARPHRSRAVTSYLQSEAVIIGCKKPHKKMKKNVNLMNI
jgi:hypothetical protein